jgi:molybdopterin synthase catalytic subunit
MTCFGSAGAVSSFLGTTRDNFEGKVVTHLEYEAYPDMALKCMLEICDKVRHISVK